MSGDAGAVVFGGILVAFAAPVIVGGALAGASVYGAYKLGQSLEKHMEDKKKKGIMKTPQVTVSAKSSVNLQKSVSELNNKLNATQTSCEKSIEDSASL